VSVFRGLELKRPGCRSRTFGLTGIDQRDYDAAAKEFLAWPGFFFSGARRTICGLRVSPIGQVQTDTPLLTEPSPVDPNVPSNKEGGPDKAKRVG
jgi:hypothetical protein